MRTVTAVGLVAMVIVYLLAIPVMHDLTGNVREETLKCARFSLGRTHVLKVCIGEPKYTPF